MNTPDLPRPIHGDTIRWYREERLHLSQREMAARVFPTRGDRAAHMALHRLESGSPVQLDESEVSELEALVDAHGDRRDLYAPMDWVIVRDPAEGVRPFVGVLLVSNNEGYVRDFLDHGKSGVNDRGIGMDPYLPRQAAAQLLPARYVREELGPRMHAQPSVIENRFLGDRDDTTLADWAWLGALEAHLRGDMSAYESPESAIKAMVAVKPRLWPANLLDRQLSRIEYLRDPHADWKRYWRDLTYDEIGPADYRRAEQLRVVRDLHVERQNQRMADLFSDR